ncbi:zinc finger protein 239-like isoform X5 [Dermacentor albipictus]|uniref:zinc finger protein 239-like isoform X5 n=1 Tax=Dermacentor albipictus TaxID=60249 RepID=UPI0038FC76C3
MSPGECITAAKVACHPTSKVIGQVEVGMQCSLPLADKSVECSFKAGSESRSVQTTETVDRSSSPSAGRHHDVTLTLQHKESQQSHLYHCDCCDYATARLPALIIHKRKHTALKPSISPSTANGDNSQQGCLHQDHLCDYKADKLSRLEAYTRVPSGECLFKCHLCPQSFSRRDTLKRHLSVHTGERPFQCPSCPQRFSQKSKVKEHLRTHTGEKPYQCPSCPQSFSQPTHLKDHLRSHTGEKPFQCPLCPQSFSRRTHLKIHLHTHTGPL